MFPFSMNLVAETTSNISSVEWVVVGHPQSVYPTSFSESASITGTTPIVVGH
jgi:hypothetical protein